MSARILIIEDEPILAYALEELLTDEGFEVVGVAGRIGKALQLIEECPCDAAILDANLAGVSASSAAVALSARGIPYMILSGYSPDQQDMAFAKALRVQKPCPPDKIIAALRSLLPVAEVSPPV